MKPIFLILLLLIFFAATFNQPDNVSTDEAHYLWMVRDQVELPAAGIRDFARAVGDNLMTMFARANGTFPLYPVLLDVWTWAAGDFAEMARLFSALCVLIGLAAILGIRQRFTLVMILLVPVLILMARQVNAMAFGFMLIALALRLYWEFTSRQPQVRRIGTALLTIAMVGYLLLNMPGLLSPKPDWNSAIQQYFADRDPLHPAITAFPAASPSGYYAYRSNLRQGIAPDLSWRSFSNGEIDALVNGLTRGGYPIWVAMPKDDAQTQVVVAALEARGYTEQSVSEIDGIRFSRYERFSSSSSSG